MIRSAQQAVAKKEFAAAIATYGRTISFLMRELKKQNAAGSAEA